VAKCKDDKDDVRAKAAAEAELLLKRNVQLTKCSETHRDDCSIVTRQACKDAPGEEFKDDPGEVCGDVRRE
jgi:hypothetical protein